MSGTYDSGEDGVFSFAPAGTRSTAPKPSGDSEGAVIPLGQIPQSPLKVAYQDGRPIDQFARGAGLGARNVIEGVGSLPGMVADVATAAPRALIRAAGGTVTAPSDWAVSDALRLPKPETEGEKTRAEFVRGASSMLSPMALPLAAPKVLAALPNIVRPFLSAPATNAPQAVAQATAGGVGAVAGDALAEKTGLPDWLKPTARLVGNVAGTVGTNSLAAGVERAVNAVQGIKNPIAQALERLGITPTSAGQVSQGGMAQEAENVLMGVAPSNRLLAGKRQELADQFGAKAEETARTAETTTTKLAAGVLNTPQRAGKEIQDAARRWAETTFPAEQKQRWAPVDAAMTTGGEVHVLSYLAALRNAAKNPALAGLPETQQKMAAEKLQEWLKALERDTANGTKPIDWKAAQALRSHVGDAMKTPDLVGSIGDKTLASLYGSLANDMKTTAILKGVGNEFQGASDHTLAGLTFQNNTLSKVISGKNAVKEAITPEQATEALMKGDSLDLQALRLKIPEAADALAAIKLRQIVQAKASKQGVDDTPSPADFLTRLRQSQMDHPEGTAALFGSPHVGQNVQDLAALAAQLKKLSASGGTTWVKALTAIPGVPRVGAAALGWQPTIATTGAQRAAPPLVPGILGGALVNEATTPARYDYNVRPEDRR